MSLFDFFKKTTNHAVINTVEENRAISETSFDDAISNSAFDFRFMTDDKLSVVYGCIRIRSGTVAQLPLKVYEKFSTSETELVDDPVKKLLKHPNKFQTSFGFWQWVVRSLDLYGNAYVQKIRNGLDEVIELIPINANKVVVKIDSVLGEPSYEVHSKAGIKFFTNDQILHFKGYSIDGVIGLSTIQTFSTMLEGYSVLEEAGTQISKNAAKPANVIFHPANLKDDELRKLKDAWASGFVGAKSGKTAWLPNTYKIEDLPNKMSAADIQYIEQKKFGAQRICADIFGVPLHMLGLTNAPTYASVEQQAIEFVQYTITPILMNIEQTLNKEFFGDDDNKFFKFNSKGLLRGDVRTRIDTYKFFIEHGMMTPNQVNELEDTGIMVPPEQGGDTYFLPLNYGPAGRVIANNTNNDAQ
jgi:HK97 family phage portal protein